MRHAALALVALLALGTSAASILPAHETNPWMDRGVLHFAHQGGEDEAPSNTLYAFKTALAKGADVLEMDVHATKDGALVVLHDTTVDRTTDGAGRVDAKTLAEVKALDAAYWWKPGCNPGATRCSTAPGDYVFRGVATGAVAPPAGFAANDFTIPTLEEVLDAFPAIPVNIEIKATAPDTIPYEKTLADLLLAKGRGADDAIVVSFLDHSTEVFRLHNDEVSTATGTGEAAAFWASAWGGAPGSGSHHQALQVPFTFNGVRVLSRDFVVDAHRNGLAVHVWTLREPAEMREALCLGVDGIMTARPSVLESVLAEPLLCPPQPPASTFGWPIG